MVYIITKLRDSTFSESKIKEWEGESLPPVLCTLSRVNLTCWSSKVWLCNENNRNVSFFYCE